ncbi:MAG TPA: guanylate kinase [Bryobacteraceae bacterium]|nr:guanylate kinase [Bryobacteraceae bacterium]
MTCVFIISAPSGSGKSTLVHRLLTSVGDILFSISYTTRAPRGAEVNGREYHFISREDFEARLARDEFLEYAQVFGNYYGTHQDNFDRAMAEGKDLLLDIDVKGARQLKERLPGAISVFILPPSRQILEERLRARSDTAESVIKRRLREAAEEIRNYDQYDYVLVNQDVEESTETLRSIVFAERSRRARMEEAVRPILKTFEQEEIEKK